MSHTPAVVNASFRAPFTLIVSGQSSSGKSTFVLNFLLNASRLVDQKFDYIVWFYGIETKLTKQLEKGKIIKNIRLHKGLPENFDDFIQKDKRGCFILDDLARETSNSSLVAELFFQKSHHNLVSVILITQNLFFEGKERKNLLRNAHNLCIFNNPLDNSIVFSLANKVLPHHTKIFFAIFDRAVSRDFGYLVISGQSRVTRRARFRTDIFGITQRCFIPDHWLK